MKRIKLYSIQDTNVHTEFTIVNYGTFKKKRETVSPRNIIQPPLPPPTADEILSRHCAGTFPSPRCKYRSIVTSSWDHSHAGFPLLEWGRRGIGWRGWESGYTYRFVQTVVLSKTCMIQWRTNLFLNQLAPATKNRCQTCAGHRENNWSLPPF